MRDKLTERTIRAAKCREGTARQKFADGGGLYLLVTGEGAKYWRMKYRIGGKEKTIAFGTYPEVTLAEARGRRDEARKRVAAGEDPVRYRRTERAAQRSAALNTFEAVAREWLRKRAHRWSARNTTIVTRRLEADVFPRIGCEPVRDLTGPRLLDVLRKIEARGAHETAHRVRQYIDAVFRYAAQVHIADANPTPHPEALTPPVRGKFASITDAARVGALIRSLRAYHGTEIVRSALQLAPLTFVRPGELRAAEWVEFDLDRAEWLIPAARMKMKRPHVVPLSRQAVEILRHLEPLTRRGTSIRLVFPSERSRHRPMSNNTLLAALRSLGYSNTEMTPHGFRHMASTLLHESRKFRSEAIEAQLAHRDRNEMRGTYNAAQYLDERREMMQWWADRLDALAGTGNVVSLRVVGS
jgi:integrase